MLFIDKVCCAVCLYIDRKIHAKNIKFDSRFIVFKKRVHTSSEKSHKKSIAIFEGLTITDLKSENADLVAYIASVLSMFLFKLKMTYTKVYEDAQDSILYIGFFVTAKRHKRIRSEQRLIGTLVSILCDLK